MPNAFEALTPKEARADKAHRITPNSEVRDGVLYMAIPVSEIGNSRKSSGEKGAVGFMFAPVQFEVNGAVYQINPGWTTLTRKA